MEVVIDIEGSTPLFAQLIVQIKQAVLAGELKPGDPLPSIRQLANDLGINHKTVAKAYRLLERDSVLRTRGYRGTSIHPDAKSNSTIDWKSRIESELSETIARLREEGATDSEIRVAFAEIMHRRGS